MCTFSQHPGLYALAALGAVAVFVLLAIVIAIAESAND